MFILSIDTSFDETAVAVTQGRKVLANAIYSQILLHKKWGGVVPSLAKRAHEERIDMVIEDAISKFYRHKNLLRSELPLDSIDHIAVTQGPGLAVALEVGIKKAKELARKYNKKLIAVNHMEGHIYSVFGQNSKGNPMREFDFPYLVLLVSGGHTELVLFKNHLEYEVIGETLDDAAGEALDKAAKLLGLGYPGGPVIERIALEVDNLDKYHFPRPMMRDETLNFSFSGLKTSFYYFLKILKEEEKTAQLKELVSSFQEAVFESLISKTERAIKKTGIKNLCVAGGVIANMRLRKLMRDLAKKYKGQVYFPPYKYLITDNAAMIGIAAYFKAEKGLFIQDFGKLDRIPRSSL